MWHTALLFYLAVLVVRNVLAIDCTLGAENMEETSNNTIPGVYLDTSNPAECGGQLTDWRLCYYRLPLGRQTYQVELQVWKVNSDGSYTLKGTSTETVTSRFFTSSFNCESFDLTEIQVERGDVLGVYLPGRSEDGTALTVIGSGTNQDILEYALPMPASGATSLQLTQMSGVRMHISANIEGIATTTSDQSTSTDAENLPTTMISSTTNESSPSNVESSARDSTTTAIILPPSQGEQADNANSGLSDGAIAGIVITVLLLLLVAIGVAVAVVLLIIYKRRNGFTFQKSAAKENNFSMSNVVYEAPIKTRGNTAILGQLDKTFKKNGSSYEIPVSRNDGRYKIVTAIPERTSQDSIYVAMEGVESVPSKSAGFSYHQDPEEYQEPGHEIAYHDSFEITDEFDEDYAEMIAPAAQINQRDPGRRRLNIYASFGPKDFNYCDYMKRVSQNNDNTISQHYDTDDPYCDPPEDENLLIHELSEKTRTISKNSIKLTEILAAGEFVDVHKGAWKGRKSDLDIVVKSLKSNAPQEEKIKLLQEAAIMGQFHHPNILQFYGVVNEEPTIMIITEYTAKGSLLDAIKSTNPDPGQMVSGDVPSILLSYSQQVALGMHYLSSGKNFIHRDLEAKNIFVTRDDICKIGELALSKELSDTEYYVSHGGEIPVAWMAPEAICYSKYSTASDVWSYGCLLYEIWSLGKPPFNNLPGEEINEMLQAGERLAPPPGCPKKIYSLMIQCWNPIPTMRPNFHDILNSLLEDEQKTLEIPHEDASVHKQATVLGGPLTAGENMYKSLQKSYTNNRFSIVDGEILYESIDQYQPVTSPSSDIKATSASSYNHSTWYSPAQNEPSNATDGDDIYDDITNCTTNFTQAATYEVPEHVQGSLRKPPLPAGPPPPLNDIDYEEI